MSRNRSVPRHSLNPGRQFLFPKLVLTKNKPEGLLIVNYTVWFTFLGQSDIPVKPNQKRSTFGIQAGDAVLRPETLITMKRLSPGNNIVASHEQKDVNS